MALQDGTIVSWEDSAIVSCKDGANIGVVDFSMIVYLSICNGVVASSADRYRGTVDDMFSIEYSSGSADAKQRRVVGETALYYRQCVELTRLDRLRRNRRP